jgi:hypothetical protein
MPRKINRVKNFPASRRATSMKWVGCLLCLFLLMGCGRSLTPSELVDAYDKHKGENVTIKGKITILVDSFTGRESLCVSDGTSNVECHFRNPSDRARAFKLVGSTVTITGNVAFADATRKNNAARMYECEFVRD